MKACLVPEGLYFRFHRRDVSRQLCAQQNTGHAGNGETGLTRELAAFLLVNNHDVSLQITGQYDGFCLTLMKRSQQNANRFDGCGAAVLIHWSRMAF